MSRNSVFVIQYCSLLYLDQFLDLGSELEGSGTKWKNWSQALIEKTFLLYDFFSLQAVFKEQIVLVQWGLLYYDEETITWNNNMLSIPYAALASVSGGGGNNQNTVLVLPGASAHLPWNYPWSYSEQDLHLLKPNVCLEAKTKTEDLERYYILERVGVILG